ncbi:MAG: hypothetical protein HFH91_21005 [Lachnospiraceae bacterium]|nr:hypothetical protein [Lachnospiraceae bacterium]
MEGESSVAPAGGRPVPALASDENMASEPCDVSGEPSGKTIIAGRMVIQQRVKKVNAVVRQKMYLISLLFFLFIFRYMG